MPELPGFSNQLLLKSSHPEFGRGAGETKGKKKKAPSEATNKIEAARSFTWRPTKQSRILPPGPAGMWTGGPEGRDPTANLQISAVIAGSNGNLQLGRSLISRSDRNLPEAAVVVHFSHHASWIRYRRLTRQF